MNYELKDLFCKASSLKARNENIIDTIKGKSDRLSAVNKRSGELEELRVIVQEACKRTQDKVKDRFETIVQSCLDVTFPGDYSFHFDFVPKRGKVETDIYLMDSNGNKLDPMDSNGGGIVDVISLALRVACLTISGKDKVLLLDEPFSHLRGTQRTKMGEVLESISHRLGVQIIMVGDVGGSSVKADKEFVVTKKSGISNVSLEDNSDR